MAREITDFDEIRIRNIPLDKKVRLVNLAKQEGKSLNKFLIDHLSNLAERYEAKEVESRYSELQKQTIEALKLNTAELQKNQQLINMLLGGNENGQ